jgi:hypothetical protein
MSDNDLTPCGDKYIDCVDCPGLGICTYTKDFNPDETANIQRELKIALKDTLGIDIDGIERKFNS